MLFNYGIIIFSLKLFELLAKEQTLGTAKFDLRNEDIPRKRRTPRISVENISFEDENKSGEDEAEEKIEKNTTEMDTAAAENHECQLPRCAECNICFRYDVLYRSHCAKIHGIYRPFACQFCSRTYDEKRKLNSHRWKKHGSRNKRGEYRNICCVCGKAFPDTQAVQTHGNQHHKKENSPKCYTCGNTFQKRKLLILHMGDAHVKSCLTCKCCGIRYNRSDDARSHENICAYQRDRLYGGNNTKFTLSTLPSTSLEGMTTYCRECDLHFDYHVHYAHHVRKRHPERKIYACPRCDKSYNSKLVLDRHLILNHQYRKEGNKYLKYVKYDCKYCGGAYEGLAAYESHGDECHPGEKLFECGVCGHEFFRKCALVRHVKGKHDVAHFKCGKCGKVFAHAFRLRDHEGICGTQWSCKLRNGANIRSYRCNTCDKTFYMKKKSFLYHVRSHQIYLNCCKCEQRFHVSRKEAFEIHYKQRHPNCEDSGYRTLMNEFD